MAGALATVGGPAASAFVAGGALLPLDLALASGPGPMPVVKVTEGTGAPFGAFAVRFIAPVRLSGLYFATYDVWVLPASPMRVAA